MTIISDTLCYFKIFNPTYVPRLIRFRSASLGGRRRPGRRHRRKQTPNRCRQRIKSTWKSESFVTFSDLISLCRGSPAGGFNSQPLASCRSSSVSSEGTTTEKETTDTEEKEEEPQRDVAAPVEKLVDASPPAAREVPAHLQRQPVRKM